MLRAATLVCLVAGCMPSSGQTFGDCRQDADCGADQTCARTSECVSGTLVSARISWTVDGQAVSPASADACTSASIDHLEVSFADDNFGDVTYSPVECKLGQILFDKMPPRFHRVTVSAFLATGIPYAADGSSLSRGENVVNLDLSP